MHILELEICKAKTGDPNMEKERFERVDIDILIFETEDFIITSPLNKYELPIDTNS